MGIGTIEEVAFDGGGGEEKHGDGDLSVACSICLEAVVDNGDRSWAKLQCGHRFHLECIGSAFNVKGMMQCPNCRKIEKGQWLFANGSRSYPEFNMEDLTHEEDLYDLNYSELSVGVHWCPFSHLRLPPAFEEGEFSSAAYHDIFDQRTIFAEHTAVPSATHPCPYIAFVGPIHPSSSNSNGSVSDGSNFSSHWNGPSIANEMPASFAFPAPDVHYHSWEHHYPPISSSSSHVGSADQPVIHSVPQRSTRATSDIPRSGSFIYPGLVSHSSATRNGSSAASSMVPPYPGSNARSQDRMQALQAYYQQPRPSNSPAIRTPSSSGSRRPSNHRSLAQLGPVASSSDQTGGFYFLPSSTSSRSFHEMDNPISHIHAWERDHFPPFSLNQTDREPTWGPFHYSAAAMPEPGYRPSNFRQRNASERTQSQNWQ